MEPCTHEFAKGEGFQRIIGEGDSKTWFDGLNGLKEDFMRKIDTLCFDSNFFLLFSCWVRRKVNYVAHVLVKFATLYNILFFNCNSNSLTLSTCET